MQLASLVSERFGFKIPSGYMRMMEAGLLSAPAIRPKSADVPELVVRALATSDLQWLSPGEIIARVERQKRQVRVGAVKMQRYGMPEDDKAKGAALLDRGWPSDFVFIPFAERRSGDEWGWAPSLGDPFAVEPPILLVSRESEDARIVAPTFATFLFRMTLDALAECPHDAKEMSLAERVAMLRGSARAVVDFLPAELSARIDRVLDLPIRKVNVRVLREKGGKFFRTADSTYLSLVGTDWAARIIREELEDPRVDQPLRID